MGRIDWDNFVLESEDFTPWELYDTIEEVREAMEHYTEANRSIPIVLEELLEKLCELEEEMGDTDE